jgi:hypothetical protein
MDRSYLKQIVFYLFVFFPLSLFSQKLLLRPIYGQKIYFSKSKQIVEGNFDPSFSNMQRKIRYVTGIGLELKSKKNSFEVDFSSQPYLNKFTSSYPLIGYQYTNISSGSFSQFQFLYNYFPLVNKFKEKKYTIQPLLSIGLGLGIIPPQSKLDYDTEQDRYQVGTNYFELLNTYEKEKTFSYSLINRIGASINKHGKELFRIQLASNLGLNKPIVNKIEYAHTSTKYRGTIASRGSYFAIIISVPILLKTFNKK